MNKRFLNLLILVIMVLILSGCAVPTAPLPAPTPTTPSDTTPPAVVDTGILQEGNELPKTQFQPKPSPELEDNRIGIHAHCFWNPEGQGVFPDGVLDADYILRLGSKRARLAIKSLDSPDDPDLLFCPEGGFEPELSIDPKHDEFITNLAENGVTITYVLSFWDTEYVAQGGEVQSPRFKTEGEIERYLDFVQFIVHHFKDRIQYYEIWNEPTIKDTIQWIEVEDYINLVKRAVPVIRQEYPEARIVVGGTDCLIDIESQEYLFAILQSDIMPLIDVVSWHPMYGTSPEIDWLTQYYYDYPSIVQEIKDVASAHGFTGEYVADEIHWQTQDQPGGGWPTYSETKSTKYLTRGIVMHLGMEVSVTQILLRGKPQLLHTSQNLCTIMAGAEPVNLQMELESEAELQSEAELESKVTNIRSYGFSLPNGDRLLALWTDGVAVDADSGIEATLTFPRFSAQKVVGIDVLIGIEQELITSIESGNLVIHNLLVKDYPLILRLIP